MTTPHTTSDRLADPDVLEALELLPVSPAGLEPVRGEAARVFGLHRRRQRQRLHRVVVACATAAACCVLAISIWMPARSGDAIVPRRTQQVALVDKLAAAISPPANLWTREDDASELASIDVEIERIRAQLESAESAVAAW